MRHVRSTAYSRHSAPVQTGTNANRHPLTHAKTRASKIVHRRCSGQTLLGLTDVRSFFRLRLVQFHHVFCTLGPTLAPRCALPVLPSPGRRALSSRRTASSCNIEHKSSQNAALESENERHMKRHVKTTNFLSINRVPEPCAVCLSNLSRRRTTTEDRKNL